MNLSVISFNIRHYNDKNGHSVEERVPRIFNILHEEKPDVIGLQEIRPHWEEYLQKNILDEYDMFLKYRSEDTDVEAAPILWKKDKFTLIDKGNFWFSDTPDVKSKGWDERFDCYRMCSYVILKEKVSGKIFAHYNTHFGFGDNCQTNSAELIYKYSRKHADLPMFVTGDFNMNPDTLGYSKMTQYFTDSNAVTANYKGTTYHGYDLNSDVYLHIDYCFINGNVKAKSYKLLNKTFDGKFPSDHYGIKVELEI